MGGITDFLSGGNERRARRVTADSVKSIQGVELPGIEDMEIELEKLVSQGRITPDQARAFLVEKSAMEEISSDPRLRNAQLDALMELQDVVDNPESAQDMAAYQRLTNDLATQERGQRESILQNAEQRGVGGSGLELIAQLQNQQGAATRAAQQGMDLAGQSEARRMDAIVRQGQLGGQIRGQDFDQQANIAQASDLLKRFNAQNQQNVEFRNVDTRNQAQANNLSERQRIADQNVNISNVQEQFNKNLQQQDFNNRLQKAGGVSGALQNQADQFEKQGAANKKFIGDIISSGATAYSKSDKRAKTDIEDFDSKAFLDAITGYKYSYKKPEEDGEGKQVGIMAQDLEKVAPQAVSEDDEGMKRIDYDRLGGPILASLADINERLKKEGK